MSAFEYRGVKLVMTCDACPEQYDAFNGRGQRIGYLRLRHGSFTVQMPGVGGEVVYSAEPEGDGMFEPDERERHLRAAIDAIKEALA